MLVSQMLYGCDLSYWATNSAIAMADSNSGPAGLYKFVDMPYNLFHTSPRVAEPPWWIVSSDHEHVVY